VGLAFSLSGKFSNKKVKKFPGQTFIYIGSEGCSGRIKTAAKQTLFLVPAARVILESWR